MINRYNIVVDRSRVEREFTIIVVHYVVGVISHCTHVPYARVRRIIIM